MASYHHFEITASYGPAQLFAALRELCESREARAANASFDFDWMKRGVWIEADAAEVARTLAEKLADRVGRDAAPGQLLVGRMDTPKPGRHRQAIGVLLQTPEVFVEVISQTLTEFGVVGIMLSADDATLEIPPTKANAAQNYAGLVTQFPLPRYLSVVDRGLVEE